MAWDMDTKLMFSKPDPHGGFEWHPTKARVWDARHKFGVLSRVEAVRSGRTTLLDGCGFFLVHFPSAVRDWYDRAEVAEVYYKECQDFIQSMFPTYRVPPCGGHILRREDTKPEEVMSGKKGAPAAIVHNDYADTYGPDGVVRWPDHHSGGAPGAATKGESHIVGIHIWRSISDQPLARWPLVLCDKSSLQWDDLFFVKNPGVGAVGNASYGLPSGAAHQRWYWYPQMRKDEALVFFTYDSMPPSSDGRLYPTLHTACKVPGSEGLHQRESVEVRIFPTKTLKKATEISHPAARL